MEGGRESEREEEDGSESEREGGTEEGGGEGERGDGEYADLYGTTYMYMCIQHSKSKKPVYDVCPIVSQISIPTTQH